LAKEENTGLLHENGKTQSLGWYLQNLFRKFYEIPQDSGYFCDKVIPTKIMIDRSLWKAWIPPLTIEEGVASSRIWITFGGVIALDLHDGLGHGGDGVGVAVSNGEQSLRESFQDDLVVGVGLFKRDNVLKGKGGTFRSIWLQKKYNKVGYVWALQTTQNEWLKILNDVSSFDHRPRT